MPTGQLVAFAVWLALALAAGALLAVVWERLRSKASARGATPPAPPEPAGESDRAREP